MKKLQWLPIMLCIMFSISSVTAQDSNANVALTLERTACFGTCPVYTVNILEDGTVTYEGQDFVNVTGKQTAEIPAESVGLMVNAFENAGYFEWHGYAANHFATGAKFWSWIGL